VPSNLSLRVQSLLSELASPLFPRVSKLRRQPDAIRALFLTGSRGMALVSAPILTTLFVYADLVLLYWIGGSQGQLVSQQATPAMRWLVAAFFIQSLAVIPSIFCEAQGRPEINNGFAIASAVIHVPLVLMLVPRLGIAGAAVALFLNSAIQTVGFILVASRRILNVRPYELLTQAFARPIIASGLVGLTALTLRPFVHGRLSLALVLLVTPLLFYGWAILLSVLTREDLGYLAPVVQRLPRWLPGRRTVQQFMRADPGAV
jgi:O-antigen/teichoic acid export membrane protein